MSDFTVGDRVFYMLPKGGGRTTLVYLPAEVIRVTAKRIVIRVDGSKNHRNVLAWSLTKEKPHAA